MVDIIVIKGSSKLFCHKIMRTCVVVVEVEVEENKFISTRQYEFSVKCYFVFKLLYKRERELSFSCW